MDTDMNDIVSPSQSSPSISGVGGQKANSVTEAGNSTMVKFQFLYEEKNQMKFVYN
jgi:hypothetical protein